HDDHRESAVGRTADPRRIGQTGHHGLGADRVAAPAATAPPAVTDVADFSHQSCRHARVDGLLHRAYPHRPRALRISPAQPPAPANHPRQHHGTSHGDVDRATDDLKPFRKTRRLDGCYAIAMPATATCSGAGSPAWTSAK